MFRVAVVIFPGTNCEGETYRSLVNAGLQPEVVRWNQPERLKEFDAYVLPGGFAYEDRSRAGIIAAQDPMMEQIKQFAAEGKPVIGICNGCQVLVETGLIPGLDGNTLAGAVAMNTRVKGGQIIGTGFYHDTVYIKNTARAGRSAVTAVLEKGAVVPATVANGEGRFIFPSELLLELEKHDQILFKYCTSDGTVLNEFPTTPNGAIWGIAGFCNPRGNVVAYMPHPERLERGGDSLFNNLRTWLEHPSLSEEYKLQWKPKSAVVETYQATSNCVQFFVQLVITDNSAKTIELALQHKGFNVTVTRKTHWDVRYNQTASASLPQLEQDLVQTGELMNVSKEKYTTQKSTDQNTVAFLVRYCDDYEGKAVTHTLQQRFGMKQIENVRKGVVWEIHISETDAAKRMTIATEILQTHILFNPYSQECKLIR